MKYQLNSYIAIFIIAAVGSWAALILVRVMTSDAVAAATTESQLVNLQLRQSIQRTR